MAVAVPTYVGTSFHDAPPGHRFRLYFDGWNEEKWSLEKERKNKTLKALRRLSADGKNALAAVRDRQALLAAALENVLAIDASTTAPFVTGMGMEHPLENGFAFLDPYGLPYLPGSGVKGVIRRAAEELALFSDDAKGWSIGAVWWLFGFDASSAYLRSDGRDDTMPVKEERRAWRERYTSKIQSDDLALLDSFLAPFRDAIREELRIPKDEPWDARTVLLRLPQSSACKRIHCRGALEFWDAYIEPASNGLRVDIMNPHFSHYYQRGQAPTDDGDPTPIFFLALPAGSAFTFHVRLRPTRTLPSDLKDSWRGLVTAAFEHAFAWLGFGAKTAIGYGRMQRDHDAERRREEARRKAAEAQQRAEEEARHVAEEQARQRQLDSMSPVDRLEMELADCGEQRAHEIYASELSKFADEDQLRVATALKNAYIRLNKWSGKLSEKQRKKISRLKEILGEQ